MDIKVNTLSISIITLLFSTSLFAENIKIENLPQNKIYDNWLISRCIGEFTDSESTRQDAFRSASTYLEFSQLPIEAFDSSEVLIHQYLQKRVAVQCPEAITHWPVFHYQHQNKPKIFSRNTQSSVNKTNALRWRPAWKVTA